MNLIRKKSGKKDSEAKLYILNKAKIPQDVGNKVYCQG